MREVCGSLMRREHGFVTEELTPSFQDIHDHVTGLIDDLDSLREIASTIVETDVSLRDHRQNLVMKQVSSWAAIIAIPTFVTGYYGMNVPYPGSVKPSACHGHGNHDRRVHRPVPLVPAEPLALAGPKHSWVCGPRSAVITARGRGR